jgi:hypothetical protein
MLSFIGEALVIYSSDQIALFSFSHSSSSLVSAGTYVLSLIAVMISSYVGLVVVSRQKPAAVVLLPAASFSLLPIVVFAAILHTLSSLGLLGLPGNGPLLTVLLVGFQAWGATIIGAGASVSSGLRVEKTLPIGIVLVYASTALVLARGVS